MVADLSPAEAPLFDLAHLERYTGDDLELQRELVALMLEQAERCLGLMTIAKSAEEWRTAVHTLKGSARGVGAFSLGELCEDAEELPDIAWPGARVALQRRVEETRLAFGDLAA